MLDCKVCEVTAGAEKSRVVKGLKKDPKLFEHMGKYSKLMKERPAYPDEFSLEMSSLEINRSPLKKQILKKKKKEAIDL